MRLCMWCGIELLGYKHVKILLSVNLESNMLDVKLWCEMVMMCAGLQALLQYASQPSAVQARTTLQVGGAI